MWITWTLLNTSRDDIHRAALPKSTSTPLPQASIRDGVLLLVCIIPIFIYVWGVLTHDWGFNEMSALFLVAGILVGLIAGMSLTDTAVEFLKGMESMLAAALFVGIARGISLVLADGHVIDTIVAALVAPLSHVPGVDRGIRRHRADAATVTKHGIPRRVRS